MPFIYWVICRIRSFTPKIRQLKVIKEAFDHHSPVVVVSGKATGILIPLDPKGIAFCLSNGLNPSYEHSCLLISDIGKLYDFVNEVPEIAWDIVDFEEKPLIVDYPEGKNLPDLALSTNKRVNIMLIKDHPFSRILYNFRYPVMWWILPKSELGGHNLSRFEYVLNLEKNPFDIFQPKRMKLELDGEIKIF